MTLFLLLGNKPWLDLNSMVFFCVEKLYITNLCSVKKERSVVGWNCCCIELTSKVTSRSVRDRYGLLDKKYKTKWNEEEKSSGTNPDYTEGDGTLMGLIQRFDEADSERKKETNEKKLKIENEQKPKKWGRLH